MFVSQRSSQRCCKSRIFNNEIHLF